jgi:cytochrome bd-type quinol oxidase subunit 2
MYKFTERNSYTLITVSLFILFLIIFYFTFDKYIQKKTTDIQIKEIVADFEQDFKDVGIDISNFKSDKAENLEEIRKQDEIIEKDNKSVVTKAIIVFTIVLLITLFYLYKTRKNANIKETIKKTLILIFFIALTEVTFMVVIAKNYKSVDPNRIKGQIIKNVLNF